MEKITPEELIRLRKDAGELLEILKQIDENGDYRIQSPFEVIDGGSKRRSGRQDKPNLRLIRK